jgi:hypothetical protein
MAARLKLTGIEPLGLGIHCDVSHLFARSRQMGRPPTCPQAMFEVLLNTNQRPLLRTTLNQLENGAFPDIGVKKVMAILQTFDQDLRSFPRCARSARLSQNGGNLYQRELQGHSRPRRARAHLAKW